MLQNTNGPGSAAHTYLPLIIPALAVALSTSGCEKRSVQVVPPTGRDAQTLVSASYDKGGFDTNEITDLKLSLPVGEFRVALIEARLRANESGLDSLQDAKFLWHKDFSVSKSGTQEHIDFPPFDSSRVLIMISGSSASNPHFLQIILPGSEKSISDSLPAPVSIK